MKVETNIKGLPEGEYFTAYGYSQSYPFLVVRRTPSTVTLRELVVGPDPDWKPEMIKGGFAGHCVNQNSQTWVYAGLQDGPDIVVRKGRTGKWSKQGISFVEGRARYFYDYNF